MDLIHSDTGAGFPLVFLHGFGENMELWNDFIPELAKTNRVININLPGFGGSPLLKGKITVESIAEVVNTFLTEKGIFYANFIGHSLGGYIVLALAETHPEIVAHLGLVNSNAFADSLEKKENRLKTVDFLNKYGVDVFMQSFVPSLFNDRRHDEHSDKIKWAMKMCTKAPLESLIAYTHAMRERPDRSYLMSRKDGKVLFLAGKMDNLINFKVSKAHRLLLTNGSFHLMREVGHMSMIEDPEMVMLLIKNFLKNPVLIER
jgi:pimeloyl-ACP methyl ester carboxylesterase